MNRRILTTAAGMALSVAAGCLQSEARPKAGECCYNPPPPMPKDAEWLWDNSQPAPDVSPVVLKINSYTPESESIRYSRETAEIQKLDTKGSVAWTYKIPEGYDRAALYVQSWGVRAFVYSSAGSTGKVVAFDATTGNVVWERDITLAPTPTKAQLGYFAGWMVLMVDQGDSRRFHVYGHDGQVEREDTLPGMAHPPTPE